MPDTPLPEVIFDPEEFRAGWPQFADPVKYPDIRLQMAFESAKAYLATLVKYPLPYDPDNGVEVRKIALYMLTCHLLTMQDQGAAGQSGPVTSATEGSVSVGFAAPLTNTGNLSDFYNRSTCGQAFWALIEPYRIAAAAGGMYVPCHPTERWG